jgi:hypothetical protein
MSEERVILDRSVPGAHGAVASDGMMYPENPGMKGVLGLASKLAPRQGNCPIKRMQSRILKIQLAGANLAAFLINEFMMEGQTHEGLHS